LEEAREGRDEELWEQLNNRLDRKKENTNNEHISEQLGNVLEGNHFIGMSEKSDLAYQAL
jgi:hypothetical protein